MSKVVGSEMRLDRLDDRRTHLNRGCPAGPKCTRTGRRSMLEVVNHRADPLDALDVAFRIVARDVNEQAIGHGQTLGSGSAQR